MPKIVSNFDVFNFLNKNNGTLWLYNYMPFSVVHFNDEMIISRNPAILIEIKGSESTQLFDNRPVFVGLNIT